MKTSLQLVSLPSVVAVVV